MPFSLNGRVRTWYRTEPRSGPDSGAASTPLLLAHGFMQSSEDWAEAGYVESLQQYRPLILVDFRGHGKSDKPHDSAEYGMELLVPDLVKVLDQLGEETVDFLGYSFGAWVGFGFARFAPERLRCLALGGMHPYVRDPYPLNRRIERFSSARDAIAAGGRHADLIPDQVKAQFADNDVEALISLTTAIRDSEGFEEALDSLEAPGLVYAGEEDPAYPLARKCVEGHEGLKFVSLPGLGHMEAWESSEVALPHIIRFLEEVT
ncbi:MAG: alpha/beta hydrolase [Chloroflexota bacterium]|nr:alpha/beta hydrolase [Chloroflexota bacterium]